MDENKKKELCKERISDLFSQIIDEIGLENTIKLARIAGGDSIYIPKAESIERPLVELQIQNEFNGYNFRQLGIKYNLSTATIRQICSGIIQEKRKQPLEGQQSLL